MHIILAYKYTFVCIVNVCTRAEVNLSKTINTHVGKLLKVHIDRLLFQLLSFRLPPHAAACTY